MIITELYTNYIVNDVNHDLMKIGQAVWCLNSTFNRTREWVRYEASIASNCNPFSFFPFKERSKEAFLKMIKDQSANFDNQHVKLCL